MHTFAWKHTHLRQSMFKLASWSSPNQKQLKKLLLGLLLQIKASVRWLDVQNCWPYLQRSYNTTWAMPSPVNVHWGSSFICLMPLHYWLWNVLAGIQSLISLASSPDFSMLRVKKGKDLVHTHMCITSLRLMPWMYRKSLCIKKAIHFISSSSFLKGSFVSLLLLAKWLNYNQLHTFKPYLQSSTNDSAHKTADLRLTHTQLSRFQVCSRWNVTHVHSIHDQLR